MIIQNDIRTGTNPLILSNGSVIYEYSHIVAGANIGKNCKLGQGTYMAAKAKVGDRTRVGNYVSIWDGVTIGKDCFIAPYVVFTNDHDPRDTKAPYPDKTKVGNNVMICANSTIIAPCNIGDSAFIGARSLILRDIRKKEKVFGTVKREWTADEWVMWDVS